jgi:hypothetical protein
MAHLRRPGGSPFARRTALGDAPAPAGRCTVVGIDAGVRRVGWPAPTTDASDLPVIAPPAGDTAAPRGGRRGTRRP